MNHNENIMSFKIAIFSLNQWSLDFAGNTARIIKSIEEARDAGVHYRAGPELELCGYSLEDAFFESDTVYHCWRCLSRILACSKDIDMVIDVGMPVHFGALYNCRLLIHLGRVLCIRAKTSLAKEGIYREFRHFQAWPISAGVVPFKLPSHVAGGKTDTYVPFGADFIMEIEKGPATLRVGWDICQELWDLKSASTDLYANYGCHLVVNSSASYWELRKLGAVNDMIRGLTTKSGACYAYSNLVGCDGQRMVFYGRSCIYDSGRLVAMTPAKSASLFEELQMITHHVNPSDIDVNRALSGIRPDYSKSSGGVWDLQGAPTRDAFKIGNSHRIFHIRIGPNNEGVARKTAPGDSVPLALEDVDPGIRFEEEIYHYVSLWLWDYLRRSRMRGFMMPLSGGLDSSTVAVLVYSLSNHLWTLLDTASAVEYFTQVHKIPSGSLREQLASPKHICKLILKCCYLSTNYSSQATESRAERLCGAIGAEYSRVSIQDIYEQCRSLGAAGAQQPTDVAGGVSLLEQNLQARLRMLMTYHFSEGNRIVLATGNVDEAIMGYLTKYDCSSADINPIGGLCKEDLRSFLEFARRELFNSDEALVGILGEIIEAPPSAELTGAEQRDEHEMGLTYEEISVLGKVRRGLYGCSGPLAAFQVVWRHRNKAPFCTKIRCLQDERTHTAPVARQLGELIKRFYGRYMRNRHKLTVLTPALHAETYSPDDNRFDHRQFLYPPMLDQFQAIDELVKEIELRGNVRGCAE